MSTRWVADSAAYLVPREPGHGDAWQEETARHGRVGTSRIIHAGEVEPPAGVVEALQLGDRVAVARRRIMFLDGRPVELADGYYPAAIARGTRLADRRKVPGGATTLLAQLGYRPSEVQEEVSIEVAAAEQCELLGLESGSTVLTLRRTIRTTEGVPFEHSVMRMVPGAVLTYRTKVDG